MFFVRALFGLGLCFIFWAGFGYVVRPDSTGLLMPLQYRNRLSLSMGSIPHFCADLPPKGVKWERKPRANL